MGAPCARYRDANDSLVLFVLILFDNDEREWDFLTTTTTHTHTRRTQEERRASCESIKCMNVTII